MENIFDKTIETLTKDTEKLQSHYNRLVDQCDTRGAIDTLRLLKDSLGLIKEYSWKKIIKQEVDGDFTTISIFEQNYYGEIRNEKTYKINNKLFNISVDTDSDTVATFTPIEKMTVGEILGNVNSNKWIPLLEAFIKNGQSMLFELSYKDHDAEKEHRNTGKTTAIVELAKKYDLPVLTSPHNAKKLKEDGIKAFGTSSDMRGYNFYTTTFLVDEGFINEHIDMDNNKELTFIGFKMVK